MIEIFDHQKEEIKAQIVIARNQWEKEQNQPLIPQLVFDEKEYKVRMKNFYSYIWKFKLPEWQHNFSQQHFLDEKLILNALQEYAREDWIKNGFGAEEFDAQFKKEKIKKYPKVFVKFSVAFLTAVSMLLTIIFVRFFYAYFFIVGLVGLFFWFSWKAFTSNKDER